VKQEISAFTKLKQILLQERKLGYQNKAVIGGLERFASNWSIQALKQAPSKEIRIEIEQVTVNLKRYGRKADQEERAESIDILIMKLDKIIDVAVGHVSIPDANVAQISTPDAISSQLDMPELVETINKPVPPPSYNFFESESKPALDTSNHLKGLDAPVTRLLGISQGYAGKLSKLGIVSIGDLLALYPRRYDDYRSLKKINQLQYGEEVTIIAHVWQTTSRRSKANRPIVTCTLSDGTGTLTATWFNQPWLDKQLSSGKQIVLSGKVNQYLGRLSFQSPDWEFLDKELTHTGRLVPIYPLTAGISAHWLRKLQKRAIDYWAPRLPEHLPEIIRNRLGVLTINDATSQIHFPDSWATLESARRRLALDELLLIQLGVLKQRQAWLSQKGVSIKANKDILNNFIKGLPYKLTKAQRRVWNEILTDMERPVPMGRLLQGDVGSGKTIVALGAMLAIVSNGGQATMLAPTEILAEQHHENIQSLLHEAGFSGKINVGLLTGSVPNRKREAILDKLTKGDIHLLVGTHAIIQDDVEFNKLQLAIVDEQHRFGVEQRLLLRQKGKNPHMLVMSATPIPRTLALTLYGDLDLSIIDEMPAGRKVVKTRVIYPRERERAYAFLRSHVEQGRQAFIICPLVEESDKIETKAAVEEYTRLQEQIFPDLKLGLLHGRMAGREKDAIMGRFRDKETNILVSTSVVEVGIDIPNTSIILVEGANRFGLAQLHQFRGRVGRGEHQSYCLLVADDISEKAVARLEVMESTSSGFDLAEADLKLRGPGEFFGTKQSGMPNLKLVKLSDTKLLELAREEAKLIFEEDPYLERSKYELLAKKLEVFWSKIGDVS